MWHKDTIEKEINDVNYTIYFNWKMNRYKPSDRFQQPNDLYDYSIIGIINTDTNEQVSDNEYKIFDRARTEISEYLYNLE